MKKKQAKRLIVLSIFFVSGFIYGLPSSAKEAKRVAILPFAIHADRDLTFLQEGIMDMLSSRLSWKGEVEVVDKGAVKKKVAQIKGPMNKAHAFLIGKALQADYVVIGSLTVFGESVSIDAKILDIAKSEELVTAFNQSKGMEQVIPTITQFAQDINEKILGRAVVRPPVRTAAPEVPEGPGGGLAPVGGSFEGKGLALVKRFPVEIRGLDGGDVDGDGKKELVFIDRTTVFVHKWKKGALSQFRAIKGGWSANHVWVSVADLDRNGRAEIYVTNLGDTDVYSYVLEWNGTDFKRIAEGQRWFFRVIDLPEKGPSLIGQRRATAGGFMGKVQFLKKEGNGYVGTGPLTLPRFGNVFNFVMADLAGNGRRQTILLGPSESLRVYNAGGEEIWKSEEYYGGSVTTFDNNNQFYIFFSSPIFVTDVDGDGKKEVMICQNRSGVRRILQRVRAFSSGTLLFLTGDETGLEVKWRSKKQSGPVVGYGVFDLDNDGRQELIIASVNKQKVMLFTPRSQIVVYDLN